MAKLYDCNTQNVDELQGLIVGVHKTERFRSIFAPSDGQVSSSDPSSFTSSPLLFSSDSGGGDTCFFDLGLGAPPVFPLLLATFGA